MLSLDDFWVWDSWVADDGESYHLFYLRAPRSLVDPDKRHAAATIGHAVSKDLTTWTDLGQTFGPREGGWDDLATWTGSVVRGDDGLWKLFYTAISTRGHGLRDQRIGLAESDDLHNWRRVKDEPIVLIDRQWYRTLEEDDTASETWRDPFVYRDPGGNGWHMLVTARDWASPRNENGVLAHAVSDDLITWTVQEPVCGPGLFGQIEVPQVRVIDGQPILAFTCHPQEQSKEQLAAFGDYCTWSMPGESVTGHWDVTKARPFVAEPYLFAAPLVQKRDGTWCLIGFRNQEPQGIFSFDIIDPVDVVVRDGVLVAP